MASNPVKPFDPTGTLASNLIVGEQHVLSPINDANFYFVVPRLAPYFADSLIVRYRNLLGEVRTLDLGIDYINSFWFISATRACYGKPIFGGISFLNKELRGTISITYQTLGGIWTLDDQAIAQIMADQLHNPLTTSWDSISNMPVAFPPIDHQWDLIDLVGLKQLVAAVDGITDAVLEGIDSGIKAHMMNHLNPHRTTAALVGAYDKAQVDAMIAELRAEIQAVADAAGVTV